MLYPAWIAAKRERRAGRGNYFIPEIAADITTLTVNGNHRGRKAGSPNKKGRAAALAPVTPPAPAPQLAALGELRWKQEWEFIDSSKPGVVEMNRFGDYDDVGVAVYRLNV